MLELCPTIIIIIIICAKFVFLYEAINHEGYLFPGRPQDPAFILIIEKLDLPV